MMKTIYSIGRDPGCDIYLYDDKKVISRNHAVLKIGKGGKYFISDQSMNGTYINGIRISSGVQVPVTRKDVITFAHVAELDWSLIPNPRTKIWKMALLVLLLLVIAGCGVLAYKKLINPKSSDVVLPTPVEPSGSETNADEQKENTEEVVDKEQEYIEWEKRLKEEEKKLNDAKKNTSESLKDQQKPAEEETVEEEITNVNPII